MYIGGIWRFTHFIIQNLFQKVVDARVDMMNIKIQH